MTRRFLCAGEVVVDLVLTVPHLPARGGDVIATSATYQPGGAVYVMTTAARQGVPVTLAGLLGTGPMADLARAALVREGIETPLPPRSDRDTAAIVTLVEPDGERSFVTTLGAEADLTDADLAAVEVRHDDVAYVSGYGLAYPNGPALVRWLATLPDPVTLVVDLGPLAPDVPPELLTPALARTDWLTVNATEAAALTGERAPETQAALLRPRVRTGVVVRAGAQGAVVMADADPATRVDPFAVHAIDTTGAGDVHTGVLVAELASTPAGERLAAVPAIRRANAAAALAVTRRGPATAPTRAEIDGLLADFARDVGNTQGDPHC